VALRPVLDLLFPALCPVCRDRSDAPDRRPFCAACWTALPLAPLPGCRICGRAWPGFPAGLVCAACRQHPPPYDHARAVGEYRDGMRAAIVALKYGRRAAIARPLGRLLAEAGGRLMAAAGGATGPGDVLDAIVPVPLHPARAAERGFNQAELLAEPCAALWGIPLRTRALVRLRPTPPQTELDAPARRANVAGAFGVARPDEVAGRRLLLVDDVLTTGATAGAAARALGAAGAAAVTVLVLARIPD
jgi:ComF family protein